MTTDRRKVLVVDDQRDIVDTISICLQQEGYEVLTAFNGHEALGVARIEQPDLIVLDVMLPKENGYQVARYIREDEKAGRLPKRTRILMLTARVVSDKDREEFLQTWSGADAFMYKPFDLDELVSRAGELLGVPSPGAARQAG
jgi:DNA-binding response OmpR family regulator